MLDATQTGRFTYDCTKQTLRLEFDPPRYGRAVYVAPEVNMQVARGDCRRLDGITLVLTENGEVGALFED